MKFKIFIIFISALSLLSGCAAYKELKPDPEINFIEDGFIELKDDKDFFELKKNKKYFMVFPGPVSNNIYLTIKAQPQKMINYYLTDRFDDGKEPVHKISNISLNINDHSVYELDPNVAFYHWVIDTVQQFLRIARYSLTCPDLFYFIRMIGLNINFSSKMAVTENNEGIR